MKYKKRKSGRPPVYRHKLEAMKVRGYLYFHDASHNSVKAIASHLGNELKRTYTTQKEDSGVSCWRET